MIDSSSGLKVDLFVLGDSLLDRRQIERRWRVQVRADPPAHVWVTSPEDVILRKLEWFAATGGSSERQWGDVIGLIRTQGPDLDLEDLRSAAAALGLAAMVERALAEGTR